MQLGNKDGGDSFIETSAIHVDHGANRENKPGWIKIRLPSPPPHLPLTKKKVLNLAICWLTLFFSSMQVMVTGNVAELEPVPKAVIKALTSVNDIKNVKNKT